MASFFIWIPKTAGTSLVKNLELERVEKKRPTEMPEKFTFPHFEPKVALDHYFPNQKDIFKFAIVRNPFDRAVSLWLRAKQKKHSGLTFREFVDRLPESPPVGLYKVKDAYEEGIENGWIISGNNPQVRWLENVDVDYIGRFEELDTVYKYLRDKIGGDEKLEHLNKNMFRRNYRTYYDDYTRKAVEEYYKEDLETYDYSY